MGDFSRDLGNTLVAAHSICGYMIDRHPSKEGFLPLYNWQETVFAQLDQDALKEVEIHLDELSEQSPRMASVVNLLKAEADAVSKFFSWILGHWEQWKLGDIWPNTKQRAAAALRRQSRKGMGVLKTLLESLIELLKGLAPQLAALLDLVKEAVKHFRE